jgi:hypothetical protein
MRKPPEPLEEGVCGVCGEDIPDGRLKLYPDAKYCVDCVKSGRAPEQVFAYRGRVITDEEGNAHTDLVTTQKEWEQVQKDDKVLGQGYEGGE